MEVASEIIHLINSYTEISPSGTGIRIFCYGKLEALNLQIGEVGVKSFRRLHRAS